MALKDDIESLKSDTEKQIERLKLSIDKCYDSQRTAIEYLDSKTEAVRLKQEKDRSKQEKELLEIKFNLDFKFKSMNTCINGIGKKLENHIISFDKHSEDNTKILKKIDNHLRKNTNILYIMIIIGVLVYLGFLSVPKDFIIGLFPLIK